MKKNTLVILVLSLVLGSCSEEVESYTVKKQDLVESVYSSVTIQPKSLYTVKASNAGYIDELLIEAGDSVELNDIILSIRDIQSRNSAENARLTFEVARSNYSGDANYLEDMKLELKDALLKKKNDSLNFVRNKELYDAGLLTKVEYEQSELAYETSSTRSKLLRNNIERTQKDLKTNLAQARNNYQSNLSRHDDAEVRSKISGIVYEVYKESGEFATTQEPIALIGSDDKFIIDMRVDEVDITKVEIGQTILVSLEAYNNQTFEARVTKISPKLDVQTQTFQVEGEFIQEPNRLYMGLNGEGNIVIEERKGALIIPLEYLIDRNYVRGPDGKIKIKTGARSLSDVEVVSGLEEGDVIIKPE